MPNRNPQPLNTLREGQSFVLSIQGNPSIKIYKHLRSLGDHYSEVEISNGIVEYMNPRTYVYGL